MEQCNNMSFIWKGQLWRKLISEIWFDYIAVKCDIKILAVCISDLRLMENMSLDLLLIFFVFKEKDKEKSISNGINYPE